MKFHIFCTFKKIRNLKIGTLKVISGATDYDKRYYYDSYMELTTTSGHGLTYKDWNKINRLTNLMKQMRIKKVKIKWDNSKPLTLYLKRRCR